MNFPVTIRGPVSASARLASKNLALIMGLTASHPIEVAWSPMATSDRLTVHHNLTFEAGAKQLTKDLEYCRGWQAQRANGSHFEVDVISWIMWFTERGGEASGPLDEHGRFDSATSWLSEPTVAHTPVLDVLAHGLRRFLEINLRAMGIEVVRESPWPDGKAFAVALSHDIDNALQTSPAAALRKVAAAGVASVRGDGDVARRRLVDALGLLPGGKNPSPYWLMPTFARKETSRGFLATYFVLPHTARRVPEGGKLVRRYDVTAKNVRQLLRDLSAYGHEIGLHTTYDAHATAGGLSRDLSALRSALDDFEVVRGARSHYLIMNSQTHAQTVEAGLDWDATVGFSTGWGFRAGTSYPHLTDPGSGVDNLWIVGLNLMDVAVSRATLVNDVSQLIREVAEVGGVASILIHPNPYDNATALEHLDLFEEVLDEVSSHGDSVWVATTSEIVAACRSFSNSVCAGHLQ